MTTNNYYNHSDGVPVALSRGSSSAIRAEFDLIQAGFNTLPTLAQFYSNISNYAVDSGTADNIIVTLSNLTTLQDGMQIRVKIAATNLTTAPTLNLNSLGAITVVRANGAGLQAGDYVAGQTVTFTYNSTTANWRYAQGGTIGATGAAGAGAIATSNTQTTATSITLTSSSPGLQVITPTANNVRINLPDATSMTSVGAPLYQIINEAYYYYLGIYDNGGNLLCTVPPRGKALVSLSSKATTNGAWKTECRNEPAGFPLCESSISTTYTSVISLTDSNGGASRFQNRTKTAVFISDTTAVSLVSDGTGTYAVAFNESGPGSPVLVDANLASIAAIIRTSSSTGIIFYCTPTGTKTAVMPFTISGSAITVGTPATLTVSVAVTSIAHLLLGNGTLICSYAAAASAGFMQAVTVASNVATAGTAVAPVGTGGRPMLFATTNSSSTSTWVAIGYQSGSAAAAVAKPYSVTTTVIDNSASSVNYVASTTTSSIPVAVTMFAGTAKYCIVYTDGALINRYQSINVTTPGVTIAAGTSATGTNAAGSSQILIINYDATRCISLVETSTTVAIRLMTESSNNITALGATTPSSGSSIINSIGTDFLLYDVTPTTANSARIRRYSFDGTSLSITSQFDILWNAAPQFYANPALCGASSVSCSNPSSAFLNTITAWTKGRVSIFMPRLAINTASSPDQNASGTRIAIAASGYTSLISTLMLEIAQ